METNLKDRIAAAIHYIDVACYLTEKDGSYCGLYRDDKTKDGFVCVSGQKVGKEMAPDIKPVVIIKCPGSENLDLDYFTRGYAYMGEFLDYYRIKDGSFIGREIPLLLDRPELLEKFRKSMIEKFLKRFDTLTKRKN